MKLTERQTEALDYLEDSITIETLFGGGAGGGKSALGCYWQLKNRMKFPGSRGLIGRTVFQTLKQTTLKTFFEIAEMQGLKKYRDFWLTGSHDLENPNCIMFKNGSMIYLKDLKFNPSDPEFESLGSFEISDAFIDEASQCVEKAKDVIKTRIRFKLDQYCHVCGNQQKKEILSYDEQGRYNEWICANGHHTSGLIPKVMMSCNPSKNWLYSSFYKPFKEKSLPVFRKFVQSLVKDNPHVSKHYISTLLSNAKDLVQRLLYGNWEYTDDPLLLFPDYDKILDMFTNNYVQPAGKKYITADIAYEGSDMFVIGVWHGMVLIKIIAFDKVNETQVGQKIDEVRQTYGVPLSNIIYDADGLKKYVKQSAESGLLKGAKQFKNGSKPIGKENFKNLKTQCAFLLSGKVERSELFISDQAYRDIMINEFEQIKQKERSDDTEKIALESKDDLKLRLGHSPDFFDMCMMRMWFELSIEEVHTTPAKVINQISY